MPHEYSVHARCMCHALRSAPVLHKQRTPLPWCTDCDPPTLCKRMSLEDLHDKFCTSAMSICYRKWLKVWLNCFRVVFFFLVWFWQFVPLISSIILFPLLSPARQCLEITKQIAAFVCKEMFARGLQHRPEIEYKNIWVPQAQHQQLGFLPATYACSRWNVFILYYSF